MVFPLNSNASPTQNAIVNPFQNRPEPQDGRTVQDRKPEENKTQPAGATKAAGVQKTANNGEDRQVVARAANEQPPPQGTRERGSLLDVTV